MKKILLSVIVLTIAISVFAQVPQAFKYQAIARDNAGNALSNQNVSFQISILQGTATGTLVYSETHNTITNEFGLANLEIGNGTIVSGVFGEIDWAGNAYFVKIELDAAGGTDYQLMGTSQLLSVPYAMCSGTTADISNWKQKGDTLYYETGNVGIGTTTPQGELHVSNPFEWMGVTFTGTGLNDLNVEYEGYCGSGTTYFIAEVTNAGPSPNIFKWSNDNGSTWNEDVQMATSGIDVGYCVNIGFGSVSGHTFGDQWTWSIAENYMDGLVVKNAKVGIGNTNPGYDLDIQSNSSSVTSRLRLANSDHSKELRLSSGNEIYDPYVGFKSGNSLRFTNFDGGFSELMRITSEGNVGIGTGSDSLGAKLVVSGPIWQKDLYSGVAIGEGAYANYNQPAGYKNVFIGYMSGHQLEYGYHNTALGAYTMENSNYAVHGNTALGYKALNSNTNGDNNIAVGKEALLNNTTGDYNIAIGIKSLLENTEGNDNIAIGEMTLSNNSTGYKNIAIGYEALYGNQIGYRNIAIGEDAMWVNYGGDENIAIGYKAMSGTGGVTQTICIGRESLTGAIGSYCTAIGNFTSTTSYLNEGSSVLGHASTITAPYQIRLGNSFIWSIGGFTSWSNFSDKRFKTEVKENVPGLEFIKLLQPVTYHLDVNKIDDFLGISDSLQNTEFSKRGAQQKQAIVQTGFIAQDVEAAAVSIGYDFSGVDAPKNENDHYGLRYAEFVVPLVKSVQEQQEMIEFLRAELIEVKNQLEELRK